MKIDEAITRYKTNAEYERSHGNLQGCLEFKQLVEWLEKLQKIKKIANDKTIIGDLLRMSEIRWVLENGDDESKQSHKIS